MTTDLMTASPPEVDERLAELWGAANAAGNEIEKYRIWLHDLIGIKGEYASYGGRRSRRKVYKHSVEEIVALAEEWEPTGSAAYYDKDRAPKYLAGIRTAQERLAEARAEAKPLEDRFERERWSRFFLVNNANGHIHSSMQCSTCRFDTSFSWLPTLSGLTEADAVEAHGAILCTVCFPSAPVEWTGGISKVEQAEKDERAAAKAAREAAKAAKAIFDTDGSVLKDKSGYEIATEVTARRELSSALQYEYMDYGAEYTSYAERLAAAIANKTGESAEELLSTGRVKAEKKVTAERKKWGRV